MSRTLRWFSCSVVVAVASLGFGAVAGRADPAAGNAPLYIFVPELDLLVPSYGRLGADVENSAEEGLLVTNVTPESPAAKLGILAGDVIVAIDGEPIRTDTDALRVLNLKEVNARVQVLVRRHGSELTFTGQLMPDYEIAAHRPRAASTSDGPPKTQLTLDVPYDARVWLNGKLMRSVGFQRKFETHALANGESYRNYPVRVEVQRDGRLLTQEQLVDLQAGQTRELVIYFDAPMERVARR